MSRTFRLKKQWGYPSIYGPPIFRAGDTLLRRLHKHYSDSGKDRKSFPKSYRKKLQRVFRASSRQALYNAIAIPDKDTLFPIHKLDPDWASW